jgi:hypothetical protein
MRRLLIAVDPGVVTGLAYWTPDTAGIPAFYELTEIDAMDLVTNWLHVAQDPSTSALVVCEDFVPRGGALTWFPESLHQIGYLKHLCRRMGIPYRLQQVKNAKGMMTDEKLKRLGWHRPALDAYRPDITSHPQAIDAARHLALAAVKVGLIQAEDLL